MGKMIEKTAILAGLLMGVLSFLPVSADDSPKYSIMFGSWGGISVPRSDGTHMDAGEEIVVTHTTNGVEFAGFRADGSLVDPTNSVVVFSTRLSRKPNGQVALGNALLRVAGGFRDAYVVGTNATWAIHALDRRQMDLDTGSLFGTNGMVRAWTTIGQTNAPLSNTRRIRLDLANLDWVPAMGFESENVAVVEFRNQNGGLVKEDILQSGVIGDFPSAPVVEGMDFVAWHESICSDICTNGTCQCIRPGDHYSSTNGHVRYVMVPRYQQIPASDPTSTTPSQDLDQEVAESGTGGQSGSGASGSTIGGRDPGTASGGGSGTILPTDPWEDYEDYGVLPERCRRNLIRSKSRSLYRKYASEELVSMFMRHATRSISHKGRIYVMKCSMYALVPESMVEWTSQRRSRLSRWSYQYVVEQVFVFDREKVVCCLVDEDWNLHSYGTVEFLNRKERTKVLRYVRKMSIWSDPE